MNSVTLFVICGSVVGVLWWNTANGIPSCTSQGFNSNGPCAPYAAEDGWYSYCYVEGGRWIAHPYRCGLNDPNNSTAGYQQFNKTCMKAPGPRPNCTKRVAEELF